MTAAAEGGQRRPLQAAALAMVALAAAGCSVSAPECSFFSDTCNPTIPPGNFAISTATVSPHRKAVQVGTPVTYSVQTFGVDNPAYQWRRSADGGASYSTIAGANGSSYTLAGANLGDDGTLFRVEVTGTTSGAPTQVSAVASLVVSSQPAVAFQDGDFNPAGWAVSALANPAQAGPAHTETRSPDGGNPGAFRTMVHTMTAGPSSLTVLHASQAASYDPGALGAVRAIDTTEDCIRPVAADASVTVAASLLIEQGTRRYSAAGPAYCSQQGWAALPARNALVAADFQRIDGPACGSGESCPDFSATALPLRFGFTRSTTQPAGAPAASVTHGIDNWQVLVWRR